MHYSVKCILPTLAALQWLPSDQGVWFKFHVPASTTKLWLSTNKLQSLPYFIVNNYLYGNGISHGVI